MNLFDSTTYLKIENKDLGLLKMMVRHGADIQATDWSNDWTPLFWAVSSGPEAVTAIEVLLENNADVNAESHKGFTALDLAESFKDSEFDEYYNPKVVKLLKKYAARSQAPFDYDDYFSDFL